MPTSQEHGGLSMLDRVLVVGVTLAPMTGLRIAKVGPAEVLVVAWCALVLTRRARSVWLPKVDFYFWLTFLAALTAGAVVGSIITPAQTNPLGLATWMYFAVVSLGILAGLRNETSQRISRILVSIATYATVWYSLLYLYSLVGADTFLGAPLWFGGARFSGGGTNPHQVAVLLVAVVYVHLWQAFSPSRRSRWWTHVAMAAATLFLVLETASDTAIVALLTAGVLAATIGLASLTSRKLERLLIYLAATVIAIALYGTAIETAADFVASDSNGPHRIALWKSYTNIVDTSPIIGLGPGTHADDGTIEFHSSPLDVFAMSGLIGVMLVAAYLAYLVRDLARYPALLVVASPLVAYGISGFSLRRLAFWAIVTILVALGREKAREISAATGSITGPTEHAALHYLAPTEHSPPGQLHGRRLDGSAGLRLGSTRHSQHADDA